MISFVFYDSIRTFHGFHKIILYNKYTLLPIFVDILSFDNFFPECDNAEGMIFKGKRSGNIHVSTMTVNPGSKYTERFPGGITWYITPSKDVISSISFKLKSENNQMVNFNGQSFSFRQLIKEI